MTAFELIGQIVYLFILLTFCLIMSRYDFKTFSVPNWPYWAGCILLIGAGLVFHRYEIYLFLISALIFAALYYLIRIITKGHLGIGDVYFGFFQGLCLHPRVVWICLATETFSALIIYVIACRRYKLKNPRMAFIPFMSLGLATAFLIDWIWR